MNTGTTPFRARFESLGWFLPERKLTSEELMKSTKHKTGVDLEKLTGIHERRVCGDDENTYVLIKKAALDCLSFSKYKPEDLEMLVVCNISRYISKESNLNEPSLAVLIKEELGANNAIAFDINNACAGMLTGVYIVSDFIERGIIKKGMVVSGENISSLNFNAARKVRTIISPQIASLTVGDAGVAAILERLQEGREKDGDGIIVSTFITLSEYSHLCIGKPCHWGPGASMFTNARMIHKVAIADSPPILKKAFDKVGLSFTDIDYLIPHQTSERSILSGAMKLEKYFNQSVKNLVVNLREYGNTASTTHFVALNRYLREGKFKKGDRIMLLSFASGLVIGIVFFKIDELVEKYGHKN
ncbi:MAG: ketoacyl-ACP synthase III [Thermoplasmata archaeon]